MMSGWSGHAGARSPGEIRTPPERVDQIGRTTLVPVTVVRGGSRGPGVQRASRGQPPPSAAPVTRAERPAAVEHRQWADFVDLGGVRRRIARRVAGLPCTDAVDFGTGNGLFALAVAREAPRVRVLGIDVVDEYLADATARAHRVGLYDRCAFVRRDALQNWPGEPRFDLGTTFLTLCDLLKFRPLDEVLQALAAPIVDGGWLLMCEAYPELATSPRERLGFRVNAALGYTYVPMQALVEGLRGLGFEVMDPAPFDTHRPALAPADVPGYLADEAHYCKLDASPVPDVGGIRQRFHAEIQRLDGIEIDCRIVAVLAKKLSAEKHG